MQTENKKNIRLYKGDRYIESKTRLKYSVNAEYLASDTVTVMEKNESSHCAKEYNIIKYEANGGYD